ncbi:hypothetical protein HDE_00495 [Halotydeus destructor]|nr:hypothetical protein HDE_00495 [Halotydeus destructor]
MSVQALCELSKFDSETRSQEFSWIDSTGELEHLKIYQTAPLTEEDLNIYSCSHKYLPIMIYSWFHRARFNFKKPDVRKVMVVGIFKGDRITAAALRNAGIRYKELDAPSPPFDDFCETFSSQCNYSVDSKRCGLTRILALAQQQDWFVPHMLNGQVFKIYPQDTYEFKPLQMENISVHDPWDMQA